jgi:SPP1 gp7 family putative phage head morphogenesis protein
LSQSDQRRTLELYREIEKRYKEIYGSVADFHVRQMKSYFDLESDITRAQVGVMFKNPRGEVSISLGPFLPRQTLNSIGALPIDGLRLGDWFDGQAKTMSLATRRVIQNGLLQGKNPLEIVRQLVPSRGVTTPTVYNRARSEATAITRTTVTAVQNHAAQATYQNLPDDVSDSYIIEAIRDSRTSVICRPKDGLVFRFDDPKRQYPPFHIYCRTGTRALVKGVAQSLKSQRAPNTFASYNEWLKAQNTATQNDILGPTRADFWRSGKMTLADAIDQDNRVLTLDQLRKKLGIEELVGVE